MKQLTDTWSEKSDKETLQKQVDLDNLKAIRTKDKEKGKKSLYEVFLKGNAIAVDELYDRLNEAINKGRKRRREGRKKLED